MLEFGYGKVIGYEFLIIVLEVLSIMNKIEYENVIAFHPGYYVKEILEELEITQEEFAVQLGVTGKTLSQLINGKINLSKDVASKLSIMLGTSVDVWLNLQQTYIEECLEIGERKKLAGFSLACYSD